MRLTIRRSVDGAARTWDQWQFDEYAVLDDQYQASAPALGELVARAWPTVEPQLRWEG